MKSRVRMAVVVLVLALGVAACGSSYNKGNTPTNPGSGAATTVKVSSGY